MELISGFFDRNIVIVFFFYGLAFFSMGLAIWLEVGRSPRDSSAKALLFLAAFGLLHGAHEWFEVYTILQWAGMSDPTSLLLLEIFRVIVLAISFMLLFIFALQMLNANRPSASTGWRATVYWSLGLITLWLFAIVVVFLSKESCGIACLTASDNLSRYILAIPASLLAAWAMITQRKAYFNRGMDTCARDITWAALALLFYGVLGQSFTRESFLFPSNIVNSNLFRDLFGVPVQLFRGLMAAIMAIFIIRALRSFELDRRQSLETANDERLAAQRESLAVQQHAQEETEQLNRELQEAVQDLTMLFELSSSLAGTLDRDVMLKQAMRNIYQSVPRIRGGMIMLRERENKPLQQMAMVGYEQDDAHSEMVEVNDRQAVAVAEAVVSSGQSYCWTGSKLIPAVRCSCTTGVPDPEQISSATGDRTLGMPLIIRELVAGSLVLSLDTGSTWLSPRDLSLIRTIAGQLNLAVANAMLYREVQARDALRGELLHQIVSAQEQERQRVARDLHDGVGQMATALGMGLAAARDSVRIDPKLAEQQLIELKSMSGQLVQELQGLIAGLRPTVLDNLGLVPALDGLVQEFEQRTHVKTEFILTGSKRRLTPDVETIVFRIAQEGFANVTKHARASLVRILIDFGESAIGLRIQDNGCGFVPQDILGSDPKHQWGLIGIRERVALVGGTCDIVSWPGDGTTIQVTIPLQEEGTGG